MSPHLLKKTLASSAADRGHDGLRVQCRILNWLADHVDENRGDFVLSPPQLEELAHLTDWDSDRGAGTAVFHLLDELSVIKLHPISTNQDPNR